MEDYNKIIESLSVRYLRSKNIKILKTHTIENFYDVENLVVLLHKGEITFGKESEKVKEGDVLFIPAGKLVPITYGSGTTIKLKNEDFINNKEKYINTNRNPQLIVGQDQESYTYLSLEAKVFDSVNFFTSLDIPPFVVQGDEKLAQLIIDLITENMGNKVGKERFIKLFAEMIVIEIIRFILDKRLFVEQLATNSNYFKDPRLIDIFTFIKNHLSGDLSNAVLADVANVSEDYVGQYFKMLTGINPQDYIEYQRMEMAVHLLRTTKYSIREIGKQVGYKDTAYFCRRFKMMFGIPAGKMRRRESLMNI
ncbi:MAG: helix-turn-helix transcriptional regulator [Opitutaceae bacterium]|nr:helix-turn-helix transcriptional regulator [Cytophagales bacterium]